MRSRRVETKDSALLFEWRNDPEVIVQSLSGRGVSSQEHSDWFSRNWNSPVTQIFICEDDHGPVGMFRIDQRPNECELSWLVAPARRGMGFGKEIVSLAVQAVKNGRVIARIKDQNLASIKAAQHAGLKFESVSDGVQVWKK